ncbi:hypothetical protein BC943DRAFT_121549 [Umbelopsis sp. AD052]|nr:hypothetical protein BC943DRAFT_121549 [Umbelopsis sp. AD052]
MVAGQRLAADEGSAIQAGSGQVAPTTTTTTTAISTGADAATNTDQSSPTQTGAASVKVNGPPAYITWMTPLPNAAYPPLYKIGASIVTMEWSVDMNALQIIPSNLTVAIVSPQKETIIAAELPGFATSATWNLMALTKPLMVGFFTVSIYDQRGPAAIPSPGQLMPDSRLTLGLYSAESYIPRTDSRFCPTCFHNSGPPIELRTYYIIIGTSIATAVAFCAMM